MQRITVIGNIGADATIKETSTGAKAISFSVAVTEKYQEKDYTSWYSCTMWRTPQQGTKIAEYLLKGTKVFLEGKPSSRAYSDKAGELKSSLDIRVDRLELLTTKESINPTMESQSKEGKKEAQYNDDLPF